MGESGLGGFGGGLKPENYAFSCGSRWARVHEPFDQVNHSQICCVCLGKVQAMAKVQVQAEIDIRNLLAQLKTSQLESFLHEIAALIAQRKAENKQVQEVRLLKQLNEDCVLSEQHWQEFHALTAKREASTLSDAERTRLGRLIQEEEQVRLKRIQVLGELSQLRGISLPQLTQELGIHPPA